MTLLFIDRNRSRVYPRPGVMDRHHFVRIPALIVCLLAVWPLAADNAQKTADSAQKLYDEARKAERSGQMARAYLLYSQAAALAPQNELYRLRSQAVEGRAALQSPPKAPASSAAPADHAPSVSPESVFDQLTPEDRLAKRKLQAPPALNGQPGRRDFSLRGDAKALFTEVAHAFGLEVVFDSEYQPGPAIRFELTEADYRQALHALEAATGSFVAPISTRMFMVVKDTEQKRRELEPTAQVSIVVPQATTTQELTEMAQGIRQIFTLEHMAWDTQQSTIVVRDRVSRVEPARMLFEELLHSRPQVEIAFDLIELDRSSSLTYGLDLPDSFPLLYLGGFWNSPAVIPTSIARLAIFGGGQTMFGVAIANATLFANMARSASRSLTHTEVRALDGTTATMHVGDRFPVLSSGYFGPASFYSGSGALYTPPPSFTFEDLGINVKVTPHIHSVYEVTLDLEAEFKVLTGQSLNGIPIISTRKLVSKVTLRDGEWGVVSGLVTSNDARSMRGIPGLSEIPVLGQLLRQNTKSQDATEVLMVIKPTLLNLPADQYEARPIRVGSDVRPLTPL